MHKLFYWRRQKGNPGLCITCEVVRPMKKGIIIHLHDMKNHQWMFMWVYIISKSLLLCMVHMFIQAVFINKINQKWPYIYHCVDRNRGYFASKAEPKNLPTLNTKPT